MMKPTFDIIELETRPEELLRFLLLIEVSEHIFTFIYFDRADSRLIAFRSYTIESHPAKPAAEIIAEILAGDDWLQGKPAETILVYAYPESNLVPEELLAEGIQNN